jgi:NitT/TauT family transport system ATP-binding protein
MQLELTNPHQTFGIPNLIQGSPALAADVGAGLRAGIAVTFDRVRKVFVNGRGAFDAINDLSFEVRAGEYTCILGRSGCGKSTTANLLLGLAKPTSGRISVFGIDPTRDFSKLRGRLACVFQTDRVLPWRSAIDNVRLPLEILKLDEGDLEVGPSHWLDRLGLRGFEHAYPFELSGGMRQRVALARALVSNPDIVIADEAFAHLDEVTGESLRTDFHRLAKETGKTVIHITHSINEAIGLADRIIVLGKPGRVLADISDVRHAAEIDREGLRTRIRSFIERSHSGTPSAPQDRANDLL